MRLMKLPNIEDIDITDVMYALSDPARVEIIRLMASTNEAMTCGDLQLDRPKSSMSHHFKILRSSGIVQTQIEGKEHYNTLRTEELENRFPGVFKSIIKYLLSQ
ncbi:ArsR/SmtB family transcription factor [Halobacteriovorax marinus]|nr:helix-turn-helix domain-containing protein [Halobacteriovorax marinus]